MVLLEVDVDGRLKNGGKIMAVISMKQLLEAGVHFGHPPVYLI